MYYFSFNQKKKKKSTNIFILFIGKKKKKKKITKINQYTYTKKKLNFLGLLDNVKIILYSKKKKKLDGQHIIWANELNKYNNKN